MAEGLPVLILLDHYPAALDNDAGNRFAHVLSHIASVCITEHGAAVPAELLGTLATRAEDLLWAGDDATPPTEVRDNLIAAAATLIAMVRVYDDNLAPLPSAEAADDMETSEPETWVGPRHDIPLQPKGGARG